MARPADSYRGARRNAWHDRKKPKGPWVPLEFQPRQSNRVPPELRPLPPARYVPYRCKPPRIKFCSFNPVGDADDDSLESVMVPYTDLRKQPKVYQS